MGWKLNEINNDALRRRIRKEIDEKTTHRDIHAERPRALVQKQQADITGKTHHGSEKTSQDEGICQRVSVSVRFEISDNRGRDLDGMLATVMDCLVKAGIIEDDSIKYIYKESVEHVQVEKGKEKAIITIKL